jgi:hypothetical protein
MHHSTKRRVALGMTTGGLLLTGIGLGMGAAQADAMPGSAAYSPTALSAAVVKAPLEAPFTCAHTSAVDHHCGNADGVWERRTPGAGSKSVDTDVFFPPVPLESPEHRPTPRPCTCQSPSASASPSTPATPSSPSSPGTPTKPGTSGTPTKAPSTGSSRGTTHGGSGSTGKPGGGLAETGSGARDVLAPLGVGLLGGGGLLLRRRRGALRNLTGRQR